jgi:hypothetical protein
MIVMYMVFPFDGNAQVQDTSYINQKYLHLSSPQFL